VPTETSSTTCESVPVIPTEAEVVEESKEIVDTNASKEEKSDEAIKAEHVEELAAIKASN